ncbi:unnamed protein product [Alternaria alternata]
MGRFKKLFGKGSSSPRHGSTSGLDQNDALTSEQTADQTQMLNVLSSRSRGRTPSPNPSVAPPRTTKDFPTGIQEWWAPSDPKDIVLDLVFVHGITGTREGTWTYGNKKGDAPWPKTFIPPLLPNVRILGFGYAADVVHWWDMVNQGRVYDYGKSLLHGLNTKRSLTDSCLTLSNDATVKSHLYSIIESTVAIAFLGTPHAGADSLANWAKKSAKFLSVIRNVNVEIVGVLKTDSEVLAILHESFTTMLKTREPKHIDITCFYEQKEVRGVGYVVSPASAKLSGWNNIPLDKNHSDMTKFEYDNDPDFMSVFGEIQRWVKATEAKKRLTTVLLETTSRREPVTQAEFAADQHATYLGIKYDPPNNSFTISIATRLFVEEGLHQIGFTHENLPTSRLMDSYDISGWATLLRRFQRGEELDPDIRRERKPICLVPFINRRFLARIPTTDVYRILASKVSTRDFQHSTSAVLVHNTIFSVSSDSQDNLPIIEVRYSDDPHPLSDTLIPSVDFCNSIASNTGLVPDPPFPIQLKCTASGHERVVMPYLMAWRAFDRDEPIFSSQYDKTSKIWSTMVDLLDMAWDDDDAWECTKREVPIRVLVDDYRRSVRGLHSSRGDGDPRNMRYSELGRYCFDWFKSKHEGEFEEGDIRNLLKDVEALAATSEMQDRKQVLEKWYHYYGLEISRWILLALTLTMGSNLSTVWELPDNFDVLLENSYCYIN